MDTNPQNKSWPKVRKRETQVKGQTYSYWVVDLGMVDGKRKFLNFTTRKAAERKAARKRIERNKIGNDALRLTDDNKQEAVRALAILKGFGSLMEAASFYVQHHSPSGGRKTVSQILAEYLESKESAGRRVRTLEDIKSRIGCLAKTFGEKPVYEITSHDIEKWLNKNGHKGITRGNYRRAFVGFWNYALKRNYTHKNVAIDLELPTTDEKIPEILTCDQVEKLFNSAVSHAPEMIPYFAICTFAGLRPAEAEQLKWEAIDFNGSIIRVSPEIAKKRRQRLVDISQNLLEWLLPYRQETGNIHYSRKEFDLVREKAGIKWSADVLRHTFGSYHLAKHENAAKTSLQMGHRNVDILFTHYRDLVRREDAEKFWSIKPQSESNSVQFAERVG